MKYLLTKFDEINKIYPNPKYHFPYRGFDELLVLVNRGLASQ